MLNKEFYEYAPITNILNLEDIKDMNIRDFDRWLNSEHAILNDSERRYLRCVVLPFYDRVVSITKLDNDRNDRYIIRIDTRNEKFCTFECTFLPYFSKDEMYCGMEANKSYTLEELGIFK